MKIVIVGGGTAGWMSALYLQRIAPDFDITLIESEDIGILGAGEGTTPVFSTFIYSLGIDEQEFIRETNASFKLGINFVNWKDDGSSYYHPFLAGLPELQTTNLSNTGETLSLSLPDNGSLYAITNFIANDLKLNDLLINNVLSFSNSSPYIRAKGDIIRAATYAYHFDAHLVAKYFRKIAEGRGVKRIEGVVNSIKTDVSDNIIGLNVSDKNIDSDFVIDCTGFKRMIIGNHFKTEWISYKDKLKVNTALPFSLKPELTHIKPYTEAIAMDYGWMWKIPIQNRYGCGYIFDSNYLDLDNAKKEVQTFLGKEIEFGKQIEFEAGRYKSAWKNNCISIGLSTGFTEPIEATAIWTIILQLLHISKIGLMSNSDSIRKEYNEFVSNTCDSISNFLQYHYFTNKKNNEFWSTYKESTTISERLKEKLDVWKYRTPNIFDRKKYDVFDPSAWYFVGVGISNDIISKELINKENKIYNLDKVLQNWKDNYKAIIKKAKDNSIDCWTLLKSINNKKMYI